MKIEFVVRLDRFLVLRISSNFIRSAVDVVKFTLPFQTLAVHLHQLAFCYLDIAAAVLIFVLKHSLFWKTASLVRRIESFAKLVDSLFRIILGIFAQSSSTALPSFLFLSIFTLCSTRPTPNDKKQTKRPPRKRGVQTRKDFTGDVLSSS